MIQVYVLIMEEIPSNPGAGLKLINFLFTCVLWPAATPDPSRSSREAYKVIIFTNTAMFFYINNIKDLADNRVSSGSSSLF